MYPGYYQTPYYYSYPYPYPVAYWPQTMARGYTAWPQSQQADVFQPTAAPPPEKPAKPKVQKMSELGKQAIANRRLDRTIKERYNIIDRQAVQLFTRFKGDPDGLMEHLKEMGVEVYSGKQYPWVDKTCQSALVEAFFTAANVIFYPDIPRQPLVQNDLRRNAPAEFRRVEEASEDNGTMLMFIRSQASPGIVMHETYHMLQLLNGVPLEVANQVDSQAGDAKIQFTKELGRKGFFGGMALGMQLGLLDLYRTVLHVTHIKRHPSHTVGASLRNNADVETRTEKFFQRYGKELGLSPQELKDSKNRLAFYKLLRMWSYYYD